MISSFTNLVDDENVKEAQEPWLKKFPKLNLVMSAKTCVRVKCYNLASLPARSALTVQRDAIHDDDDDEEKL